mmetsp:Transcript_17695/g.31549  ORF Transcript_17695/g.31549 Transcript_17695/m.31549 type:complete len:226 (-) Transcript_17695:117-794(-)
MSAGTLSPTFRSTMSPGTNSRAGRSSTHFPLRRTRACSLCSSFSAAIAFSALLSCHTPTMALIARMRRMTKGSMYARNPSSSSSSAPNIASRSDTVAASSSSLTRVSSNCSRTSFHRGLPSSFSSSLKPYRSRAVATASASRPLSRLQPSASATSPTSIAHAGRASSPFSFELSAFPPRLPIRPSSDDECDGAIRLRCHQQRYLAQFGTVPPAQLLQLRPDPTQI